MLKSGGSFGKKMSKKFKIGDLVSWKKLGKGTSRDLGLVIELNEREEGGNNICSNYELKKCIGRKQ